MEENYQKTPADKIFPKRKSETEKREQNKKTRSSVGRTTLLYRQVRRNRDIALLAFIIATACFCGWTIKDIEFKFKDVIKIIITLSVFYFEIIWFLHTPEGRLKEKFRTKGNKDDSELGDDGRTIMHQEE